MKIHPIPSTCILLISLLGTANAGLMITAQDEGMTESTIYQAEVMIQLDGNKKARMIVDSKKNSVHGSTMLARNSFRAARFFPI